MYVEAPVRKYRSGRNEALVRSSQVLDEEFEKARNYCTDKELVDLTFAVALMNTLNRIAISFHHTPAAP